METTKNKIEITDSDLGFWFGIDGKAIANQEQLDLAIVALAGLYGFMPMRPREMKALHHFVYSKSEFDDGELMAMTMLSERAVRHLNKSLPAGYKFDFEGEEYDKFVLIKS